MLTKKDRRYAMKRKKMWDRFEWAYKGVHGLSKNHSLHCGCSQCRYQTYDRRASRKRDRLNSRRELRKETKHLVNGIGYDRMTVMLKRLNKRRF